MTVIEVAGPVGPVVKGLAVEMVEVFVVFEVTAGFP